MNKVVRELKIKYTWEGGASFDVDLYVSDGKGIIKGLLLPDGRFLGVSRGKDSVSTEKEISIFEGKIDLDNENGELRLKKTYIGNRGGDIRDYMYIAKRNGKNIYFGGDIYSGSVWGSEEEALRSDGFYYAISRLEVIIKKTYE